jgi:voltage-gated potassium channel
MNSIRHKIFLAISFFILLIFLGVVVYHYFSHFSWVDALYMTVITITTVGFGEVHPLTDMDKVFTVVLIFLSIGIYGYGVSIVSEFILNNRIFENIINKRMENKIKSFNNHIILAGYGRVGKTILNKLSSYDKQVVVIEKNMDELNENHIKSKNIVFLNEDATKDEVLLKAGIKRAKTMMISLGDDADNLFIVLTARQLNPSIRITISLPFKKLNPHIKRAKAMITITAVLCSLFICISMYN